MESMPYASDSGEHSDYAEPRSSTGANVLVWGLGFGV